MIDEGQNTFVATSFNRMGVVRVDQGKTKQATSLL